MLALASLTLAVMASSGADALPKVKLGMPYPEARAALIRVGFTPVPFPHGPADWLCDLGQNLCRFPEFVDCRTFGSRAYGQTPCVFLYKRKADGKLLLVETLGGDFPASLNGMGWVTADDRAALDQKRKQRRQLSRQREEPAQ